MNEGRDVWSGGNMVEKSSAIHKSLCSTLKNFFQPGVLFPKTTPVSDADAADKRNEQEWDDIQKTRKEIDRPFEVASVEKAGGVVDPSRAEASRKAWDVRGRSKGDGSDKEEKPSPKPVAPPAPVPGAQRFVSHSGEHSDHVSEAVKSIAQMKDTTPAGASGVRSYGRDGTAGENVAAIKGLVTAMGVRGFKLVASGKENPRVDTFEHSDGSTVEISRKRELKDVRRLIDIAESGVPEDAIRAFAAKLPEKLSIRIAEKGREGALASPQSAQPAKEPPKPKAEKSVEQTVDIEKILKDSGFDRLPMTDKAKSIVEDAITKGALPVTEYTGKLMIERSLPEEPPAFVRPKQLKAGDRVVALQWMPMGVMGSKFDLPFVPPAVKVKKLYMAPVKVTKESFPPGQIPKDFAKLETVIEQRLWGMDVESEDVKKQGTLMSSPLATRDTTLVLRLVPLASPSGETQD